MAEDETTLVFGVDAAVVVETAVDASVVSESIAQIHATADSSVAPASDDSDESLAIISQTSEEIIIDTDTTVLHDETPIISHETIDGPIEHMPIEEDPLMPIVSDVEDIQATDAIVIPILEEKPDETIVSDTDTRTISVHN